MEANQPSQKNRLTNATEETDNPTINLGCDSEDCYIEKSEFEMIEPVEHLNSSINSSNEEPSQNKES